jgi:hypothetical protein
MPRSGISRVSKAQQRGSIPRRCAKIHPGDLQSPGPAGALHRERSGEHPAVSSPRLLFIGES